MIHIRLKLLIDPLGLCLRKITQMDALGCCAVYGAHKVLVYLLRHERDHRSGGL